MEKAYALAEKHDFQTPLDEIDAAARVVDPILTGVSIVATNERAVGGSGGGSGEGGGEGEGDGGGGGGGGGRGEGDGGGGEGEGEGRKKGKEKGKGKGAKYNVKRNGERVYFGEAGGARQREPIWGKFLKDFAETEW